MSLKAAGTIRRCVSIYPPSPAGERRTVGCLVARFDGLRTLACGLHLRCSAGAGGSARLWFRPFRVASAPGQIRHCRCSHSIYADDIVVRAWFGTCADGVAWGMVALRIRGHSIIINQLSRLRTVEDGSARSPYDRGRIRAGSRHRVW